MQRVVIPGLRDEGAWFEIGYSTGDATFPLARVRVVPINDDLDRTMPPNAAVAPPRVRAQMSASLVDAQGQVLTVADRLLVGPESRPSNQFEAGAFDPQAWIDARAEELITPLLLWAKGLTAAAAGRLLAPIDPWSPPSVPEAGLLAVREYLRLFTPAELGAILGDDDTQMRIIVANTLGARNIDLKDSEVAQGIGYCVVRGHLAVDRPEQILANQPPA